MGQQGTKEEQQGTRRKHARGMGRSSSEDTQVTTFAVDIPRIDVASKNSHSQATEEEKRGNFNLNHKRRRLQLEQIGGSRGGERGA